MIEDFGLVWPACDGDDLQFRVNRLAAARDAARRIALKVTQHRVCVQAGGHIGLWPRELAKRFDTVYTFEPDAKNFECLLTNVPEANVTAVHGALGAAQGSVGLTRSKEKSGIWRTVPEGDIPVYAVDDMDLYALDALVLDVEGDEWKVIQGTQATILRCRPLVWFEARLAPAADVIDWLRGRGYGLPERALGRDLVMAHANQTATV